VPGQFGVKDAVLAYALIDRAADLVSNGRLGKQLNVSIDDEQAAAGIRLAQPPGRMQSLDLGPGAPVVYIDFGHTPQAIEAALQAVPGPRIAVLGAGGDRDATKRPLMGAAAARNAQIVVVTDDNPRSEDPAIIRDQVMAGARQAARESGAQVVDGADRQRAIATALRLSGGEYRVVILGKGHENTQEIAGIRHPFNDLEATRLAWRSILETQQTVSPEPPSGPGKKEID
jgi:UDP-N-acetylmuramoyl-L-alanyl-D-glutamate--2,6-diaminopimelate ligase